MGESGLNCFGVTSGGAEEADAMMLTRPRASPSPIGASLRFADGSTVNWNCSFAIASDAPTDAYPEATTMSDRQVEAAASPQ